MLTIEEMITAVERTESDYFKPLAKIREIRITNARNKLMEIMEFLTERKGEKLQWLPEYDDVASWLENNKRKGLLLMGHLGTGKSLLCSEAIPMLLHTEYKQNYYTVPAWALADKLEQYLKDDICIIDDIGTEPVAMIYGKPVHAFSIIAANAEHTGQLLIITTNLNYKELAKKYDLRVIDRIRSITTTIAISGDSFRGRTKMEPSGNHTEYKWTV